MEAIIGFAIGYLVGVREGPAGLERMRTSWRAIRESPELRELVGGAVTVAGPILRKAMSSGGGEVLRTAFDAMTQRGPGSTAQRAQ